MFIVEGVEAFDTSLTDDRTVVRLYSLSSQRKRWRLEMGEKLTPIMAASFFSLLRAPMAGYCC